MAYEVKLESQITLHTFARDPKFREMLQEGIRAVMWSIRNDASKEIQEILKNDPRSAYRAVHNSVYKKIIGGNINILTQRKALRKGNPIPAPSNRYGKITGATYRGRTRRTLDFYGYNGIDRGMILRWLNDGTSERYTKNMDGGRFNVANREMIRKQRDNWHNKSKGEKYRFARIGGRGSAAEFRRGSIDMFAKTADKVMPEAQRILLIKIDEIISEMFV